MLHLKLPLLLQHLLFLLLFFEKKSVGSAGIVVLESTPVAVPVAAEHGDPERWKAPLMKMFVASTIATCLL